MGSILCNINKLIHDILLSLPCCGKALLCDQVTAELIRDQYMAYVTDSSFLGSVYMDDISFFFHRLFILYRLLVAAFLCGL